MEIKLLKGKVVNGETHPAGATLEVTPADAKQLIATKAAVAVGKAGKAAK